MPFSFVSIQKKTYCILKRSWCWRMREDVRCMIYGCTDTTCFSLIMESPQHNFRYKILRQGAHDLNVVWRVKTTFGSHRGTGPRLCIQAFHVEPLSPTNFRVQTSSILGVYVQWTMQLQLFSSPVFNTQKRSESLVAKINQSDVSTSVTIQYRLAS